MEKRTPKTTGATKWWRCSTCKDWKLPSKYRKSSLASSGLQGRCKDCDKFADKESKASYEERQKQTRVPSDMNGKRAGTMKRYMSGKDTLLSYDEFENMPSIKEKE
tara:strand:- start:1001 stop:1318 length:318 start_codon:yes stop_codon:yes gene_type:complete